MTINSLQSILKTKDDISSLISSLYKLNEYIFAGSSDIENYIYNEIPFIKAEAIKKCLTENNFDNSTNIDKQKIVLNLIDELKKIPIVHVILAFNPKKKFIDEIHTWFWENLGGVYVVEITIDKSIVAGSIISFNGVANDYSIERKLEQFIEI